MMTLSVRRDRYCVSLRSIFQGLWLAGVRLDTRLPRRPVLRDGILDLLAGRVRIGRRRGRKLHEPIRDRGFGLDLVATPRDRDESQGENDGSGQGIADGFRVHVRPFVY